MKMNKITKETILKTRQEFVDLYQRCIQEVEEGITIINNPEEYCAYMKREMDRFRRGDNDHTFTFKQRAHYIQTGECIPFLKD